MISERLRLLRRELNISKRELVSQLPLNYSTYANYESGFREPNSDVLQMLAKHLDVSVDFLLGVSDNRRAADDIAVLDDSEHNLIMRLRQLDSHSRELVQLVVQKEFDRAILASNLENGEAPAKFAVLPVYPLAEISGLGHYLNTNETETMNFMPTPVSQKADFCVRITDDSMEPKIRLNDIIFVKYTTRIEPDTVGIFILDGEAICRRLRVDKLQGRVFLESINRTFQIKEITTPTALQTIGMVIGIAER